MRRRVYAYSDLRELCEASFYGEICDLPMITTSYDMSRLMWDHPDIELRIKPRSFSSILSVVSSGWNNEADRVSRMALASEYLRLRMLQAVDDLEYEWLRNWRKNKDMLLSNIVLFVEAGIDPDDFPKGTKDLDLMLDLWRYILVNSRSIQKLKEGLGSLSDPASMDSLIMKIFGCSSKTIVLHGFYFITPIQEQFFMLLEECGYDLIMLIHYDVRYPHANEIWRSTYSPKNGYPRMSEWIIHKGKKVNLLGEVLEGRFSETETNIDLTGQGSLVDLIHDVGVSREKGYVVFSPDSKGANEILRDFFPDEYENRTLMSYPLGQFIHIIYGMWDDDQETIIADVDDVRGCLSTGWLSFGKYDSRDYVGAMGRVSSFFQDCSTRKEWESRFGILEQIYSDVIPELERSDGSDDRWSRMMSNPLSNIATFTLDRNELDAVVLLVERMFNIAEELFVCREGVTIRDHLDALRSVIKRCSDFNQTLSDEFGIMDSILNRATPMDHRCYSPCDMRDAVVSFLNEGTDEYEENGPKLRGLVKPLRQIEESFLDGSKGIHIILANIKRLPGREREFIWPVTDTVVSELFDRCNPIQQRLLADMVHIMWTTPESNRFLTYLSFYYEKVELSWVRNMDSKNHQPSPFIRMLSEIGGLGIRDSKRESSVSEVIQFLPALNKDSWSFDIRSLDYVSNEAKMDYSLCPLRYLYGYVLDDHPSYSSSFHIQFIASNLITAIRGVCPDVDPRIIMREVMSLFPNLKSIEKRQILDFSQSGSGVQTTDYGGFRYTNERYRLSFPKREVRAMAGSQFGVLYTPNGRIDLRLDEPSEFKGACVFCQHGAYCRRIIYGIDQEDYYGR